MRMRTGPYDDECSWRGLAPREAFSPSVLLAVRSPSVSSPSSPSLSSPSVVLLGVRSAPADGCTLYIHVVSNHLRAGTYVSKTEESKAAQEVLLYVRARVHSNQRAPVGEHKHMTLGKKVTAIKLIEGQKYPAWIASGHGHFCHACATSARLMFWARNKRELATQPTQRHRGTEARWHRGTEVATRQKAAPATGGTALAPTVWQIGERRATDRPPPRARLHRARPALRLRRIPTEQMCLRKRTAYSFVGRTRRADRRTEGRTNGQKDGRTDRRATDRPPPRARLHRARPPLRRIPTEPVSIAHLCK